MDDLGRTLPVGFFDAEAFRFGDTGWSAACTCRAVWMSLILGVRAAVTEQTDDSFCEVVLLVEDNSFCLFVSGRAEFGPDMYE